MREYGKIAILEKSEEEEASGDYGFDEKVIEPLRSLRPKEKDFHDLYPLAEIDEDLGRAKKIQRGEYQKKPKMAVVLEYCLMEGIASWNWLGPEAEVVPASEYDDVGNKIDFIICFPRENGPSIKLAVDVTTSGEIEVLRYKIRTTAQELKNGNLAKTKYFSRSEDPQEPRGKVRLPKVIIGTDQFNTNLLFKDFCEVLKAKKEKGERLAGESIQFELLRQIKKQLCYFLEIASRKLVDYAKDRSPKQFYESLIRLEEMQDLSKEIKSYELDEFLAYLKDNEPKLRELDPYLANNIFSYLEVILEIDKIAKEKRLPTQAPEALSITEKELEMTNGKLLV